MKHQKVGIALLSILIIAICYNVVQINLNLLLMNISNIIAWIARLLL